MIPSFRRFTCIANRSVLDLNRLQKGLPSIEMAIPLCCFHIFNINSFDLDIREYSLNLKLTRLLIK